MFKKAKYIMVALVVTCSLAVTPAGATSPQNNRPIVYTNGLDGHVVSVNPDGSNRRDYGPGLFPRLSPDGKNLAFSRDNADFSARDLYVVQIGGSSERKVAERIYTPGSQAYFFSWAPDSKKLTYTTESGETNPETGSVSKQIATVHIDGSDQKQLTADPNGVTNVNPVWSPDGKKILYQRNTSLYTINASGGDQRQVVENAAEGSWAPSSDKILFTEPGVGVRTAAADGTNRTTISPIGSNARWSPDGKKIVMEAPNCGCTSEPNAIIMFNSDGSNKTLLASPPTAGTVQHPVWSPDSKSVAFVEFARQQPAQLIRKPFSDGSASVVIVERVGYPEWAYLSQHAAPNPPHHSGHWYAKIELWYQWLMQLWR